MPSAKILHYNKKELDWIVSKDGTVVLYDKDCPPRVDSEGVYYGQKGHFMISFASEKYFNAYMSRNCVIEYNNKLYAMNEENSVDRNLRAAMDNALVDVKDSMDIRGQLYEIKYHDDFGNESISPLDMPRNQDALTFVDDGIRARRGHEMTGEEYESMTDKLGVFMTDILYALNKETIRLKRDEIGSLLKEAEKEYSEGKMSGSMYMFTTCKLHQAEEDLREAENEGGYIAYERYRDEAEFKKSNYYITLEETLQDTRHIVQDLQGEWNKDQINRKRNMDVVYEETKDRVYSRNKMFEDDDYFHSELSKLLTDEQKEIMTKAIQQKFKGRKFGQLELRDLVDEKLGVQVMDRLMRNDAERRFMIETFKNSEIEDLNDLLPNRRTGELDEFYRGIQEYIGHMSMIIRKHGLDMNSDEAKNLKEVLMKLQENSKDSLTADYCQKKFGNYMAKDANSVGLLLVSANETMFAIDDLRSHITGREISSDFYGKDYLDSKSADFMHRHQVLSKVMGYENAEKFMDNNRFIGRKAMQTKTKFLSLPEEFRKGWKEMKQEIGEKAEQTKEKGRRFARRTKKEVIDPNVEKAKQMVDKGKEAGTQAIEKGKEAGAQAIEKGKRAGKEAVNKASNEAKEHIGILQRMYRRINALQEPTPNIKEKVDILKQRGWIETSDYDKKGDKKDVRDSLEQSFEKRHELDSPRSTIGRVHRDLDVPAMQAYTALLQGSPDLTKFSKAIGADPSKTIVDLDREELTLIGFKGEHLTIDMNTLKMKENTFSENIDGKEISIASLVAATKPEQIQVEIDNRTIRLRNELDVIHMAKDMSIDNPEDVAKMTSIIADSLGVEPENVTYDINKHLVVAIRDTDEGKEVFTASTADYKGIEMMVGGLEEGPVDVYGTLDSDSVIGANAGIRGLIIMESEIPNGGGGDIEMNDIVVGDDGSR